MREAAVGILGLEQGAGQGQLQEQAGGRPAGPGD
jgi:hypothetical protein